MAKKIVISDSTKKKKPQRISPWHIFTLPQPAPVVLGLFSKRRECWETYPLGGNGSLPWESLSRICPLRPWINSSECWFLEIWRAAAIASDCLSNVEVSLELPSPLMPPLISSRNNMLVLAHLLHLLSAPSFDKHVIALYITHANIKPESNLWQICVNNRQNDNE